MLAAITVAVKIGRNDFLEVFAQRLGHVAFAAGRLPDFLELAMPTPLEVTQHMLDEGARRPWRRREEVAAVIRLDAAMRDREAAGWH